MNTKWLFKDAPNLETVDALKKEMNVSEVVAYMLVQRGITDFDAAKSFFRGSLKALHDPFLMKGMDRAVARVNKAIAEEEKILIYGDYDVDGTTAIALVYGFLSQYTSNIAYYIPDRYDEGYGVSEKGIKNAKKEGYSLVITLDCGIKANEKVDLANSLAIDMIICDHHTPGNEIPNAIVLDPKRKDCEYPYKELSGCGVGFKLLQGLTSANQWDEVELFKTLDLLAISIAADLVPVTGENRLLSQYGLKQLNQHTRLGIDVMLNLAKKEKPLSFTDIVFTIAPRINAAGRIDDAKKAVKLLTSQDKEEVRSIAKEIQEFNDERKALDKEITEHALEKIAADNQYTDKCTTVVYDHTWHKGVIGIVASRLIEKHYRPTIVMTQAEDGETWTGSARSIKGIDMYEVLDKCSAFLEKFGGHYYAAGLTLKTEHLSRFENAFEKEVQKRIGSETLIPEQIIEKELPFNQLFNIAESIYELPRLMRVLKQFEPHGPENMKPLFVARNVYAHDAKLLKGEHLKMKVYQPDFQKHIDAIFFKSPTSLAIVQNGPFDMVFTLEENTFRGKTTPQLMVKDLRPTDADFENINEYAVNLK
ncbi:single-stranded-DNA-specific exonuclease RecJ [Brumimicrobium salinarum]|uniref:Single-stranded-DNA-specific exonuclease RecJ n=1 Tax=Brumimicrobium salinarum TaxID=2058658 RepID=A0A2I0R021_9FLAO|nr:single-stranded-DNA-specific exonuclease RecJ [Brumimicrobium salinarum]PKR79730.1 single-stranded-DNA-specific exonuclease RecJ [Brumimicrobium salinarum]